MSTLTVEMGFNSMNSFLQEDRKKTAHMMDKMLFFIPYFFRYALIFETDIDAKYEASWNGIVTQFPARPQRVFQVTRHGVETGILGKQERVIGTRIHPYATQRQLIGDGIGDHVGK